jgi:hypothetical protein
VHERLLEGWLDSASERSYQVPFCQMLVADGHRILHSTRHAPIELGKDIITLDRDRVPCAFQLKGHPGGRLTLHGFQEILEQLRSLIDLAIQYPGLGGRPHRSFLVTNGLIEEEAALAISQLNQGYADAALPNRRLEVIQRGDLLDMANRLGEALWPTEIDQTHLLLEMLVEDGAGLFPAERANLLLSELLGLGGKSPPKWSAANVRRRITSAALLTSLSLKNFDTKRNHFAVASAWTQFSLAAVAACSRFDISFDRNGRAAVDVATTAIRDALVDLATEVLGRETVLIEGDVMWDAAFYKGRYTLILALLSLLWLWCEEDEWPPDLPREALEEFLSKGKGQLDLWGEAAIPQLLLYYWFLRRTDARSSVDALLLQLLSATISRGPNDEPRGLPSPYWSYEAVTRHRLSSILGSDQDELATESTGVVSYYAESLLHLLVRANWKNACRDVWPNVSRMLLMQFRPANPWQFCLSHCEEGSYEQVQPPLRKEWLELVEEARFVKCDSAPKSVVDRPPLLALFILLFPYRGRPDVIRHLSYVFNRVWHISGAPIE